MYRHHHHDRLAQTLVDVCRRRCAVERASPERKGNSKRPDSKHPCVAGVQEKKAKRWFVSMIGRERNRVKYCSVMIGSGFSTFLVAFGWSLVVKREGRCNAGIVQGYDDLLLIFWGVLDFFVCSCVGHGPSLRKPQARAASSMLAPVLGERCVLGAIGGRSDVWLGSIGEESRLLEVLWGVERPNSKFATA